MHKNALVLGLQLNKHIQFGSSEVVNLNLLLYTLYIKSDQGILK